MLALALSQSASAAAYMQRFVYGGDFVGANSASCDALAPIFHNVAALGACEQYKNQIQIGAQLLRPSARIRDIKPKSSFANVIQLEHNDNDILPDSTIGNVFYSRQLASELHFAAALFTPYAFEYHVKYSRLDLEQSFNASALRLAFAYKLKDNIFVGAGTDVYHFQSRHRYRFSPNSPIKIGNVNFDQVSMKAKLNARDIGFNIGALFILNNGATRWGLNYQSGVKAMLQGSGKLHAIPSNAVDLMLDMPLGLPPILSAAMQQHLGKWQLGAQLAYNDWAAVGRHNRVLSSNLANSAVSSNAASKIVQQLAQQTTRLRSTLGLSAHIHYQMDAHYSVGLGYSIEQSPVEIASNNMPFSAQQWLHLGAAYRQKTWSLTGGFAYMRKSHQQYNTGISIDPNRTGQILVDLESSHVVAGFMFGYLF